MPTDSDWPSVPAGAVLLAWDVADEADSIRQTRLYRTSETGYRLIERRRARGGVASTQIEEADVDVETALKLFLQLRVRLVTEESAFSEDTRRVYLERRV